MESTGGLANVDKSDMPPLNHKRILAFVNHFLISTCTFLNEFALGCEHKFIELERKLQKTEAALIILEAKLASIPMDNETSKSTETTKSEATIEAETPVPATVTEIEVAPAEPEVKGVHVNQDVRYKKFFKMLQVGVPAPAVKQKMQSEGLEPHLLDTPNHILPDGVSDSASN